MFGLFKPAPKPLRLMAHDADDLALMAALTQDAVLKVSDMVYDPRARALSLSLSRFCHETGRALRTFSGLRIDNITALKYRGFEPKDTHAVLDMLDIFVEPKDDLAHILTLRFAGAHDTDIRVEVEAIEVMLVDMGAPRRVKSQPNHV
jgi:hypothetical protein